MPPQSDPEEAGLIVIPRLAVAVCAAGFVESVTVKAAVVVPLCVGVPVIAPVAAAMDNPEGRLLAL
jgi:hypothetical protein